eukprot:GILK01003864.1.p1 GENE.GILK01003864.1~~GILK01003864.1.p1  ORF type:complete len:1213 (-),score=219.55 GILK01003864.1:92-3730(-)
MSEKKVVEWRTVYVGDHERNKPFKFISNDVITARYTIWNFLFISLFLQFLRLANIYFLLVAVLQSIPEISPLAPFSAVTPLAFVLGVSLAREAVEDWGRHKDDKFVNNQHTEVYRPEGWVQVTWKEVLMGDIVRVKDKEPFPSDLVLLNSSEIDGVAYIETASLDGERNLKIRQALKETVRLLNHDDRSTADHPLKSFRPELNTELPNNSLYRFEATMKMDGQSYSLDAKQLLLRGAILKNTKWIVGIAVFTGHDTKLMQNGNAVRHKQSSVESMVNRLVVVIIAFELALCLLLGILSGIWSAENRANSSDYLGATSDTAAYTGFIAFWSYFLLVNTMIPISLIVAIEVVKLIQAFFINNDLKMYYAERDIPCRAVTSTLNEELGQVKYIFSDKTGTLTANKMEFKTCSIGGVSYGSVENDGIVSPKATGSPPSVTVAEKAAAKAAQNASSRPSVVSTDSRKGTANRKSVVPERSSAVSWSFSDQALHFEFRNPSSDSVSPISEFRGLASLKTQRDVVNEFWTAMSVCHTVIPETDEEGEFNYQGSSPDEVTLADAAKRMGFFFHTRNQDGVIVNKLGSDTFYEVLNVLEFNSTRKRMSVIVRTPENQIKLYCKGADSIILSRCKKSGQIFESSTREHLNKYSRHGLRTLAIGVAVLSEEQYANWQKIYHEASVSMEAREDKIFAAAELIEKDLFLLGATGVEDKLQDGVPETIESLQQAGINVWMLTGDKLETAVNIGTSCRLLNRSMTVFTVDGKTKEETKALIIKHKAVYERKRDEGAVTALVIDGSCLDWALETDLLDMFVNISIGCKSVICCRASPLQKATVVRVIKDRLKDTTTLSVGDGANDVPMIKEAHIGIGIYGEEGMQAVQSSDYAIGQFRFLYRLLLVHGRWSYIRVSHLILYFFYKNICFTFPQFFFAFYCAYSGQTYFDDWYITMYNLLFTSVPVVVRACLEQDINPEVGGVIERDLPRLYYVGQNRTIFTYRNFLLWWAAGFGDSLVAFFVPFYLYAEVAIDNNGYQMGFWGISCVTFTCVVFVVNLKICLHTMYWTWIHSLGVFGVSIGIYICFAFGYDILLDVHVYRIAATVWGNNNFWLIIALQLILCLVPDLAYRFYTLHYQPDPATIYRELAFLIRTKQAVPDIPVEATRAVNKREPMVLHSKSPMRRGPGDEKQFKSQVSLEVEDLDRGIELTPARTIMVQSSIAANSIRF